MGFFFFLSGFFSARSLQKVKPVQFLTQRLLRLGLPILLFVYLISPLIRLLRWLILAQQTISLEMIIQTYRAISFGPELGPMWFALLLLILSFVLFPFLVKERYEGFLQSVPTPAQILLFALLIGCLTFSLRIFLPVGYVFSPLNLQLPYTLQYIFLFWAGSLIYHRDWLERIDEVYSNLWLVMIAGLLIILPIVFVLSGGLEGDVAPALGGLTWQSFVYSVWEQLLCVSLIIVYLRFFRIYANQTAPILKELAASSYAAYLIHPLILVVFSALIDPIKIHPLGKISLALIPGLVLSFLAAGALRRVPGLRQIL
jgi:hypothetical protein